MAGQRTGLGVAIVRSLPADAAIAPPPNALVMIADFLFGLLDPSERVRFFAGHKSERIGHAGQSLYKSLLCYSGTMHINRFYAARKFLDRNRRFKLRHVLLLGVVDGVPIE